MKIILKIFTVSYASIIFLFICCALSLICFAVLELWRGINPGEALPLGKRFHAILESIGLTFPYRDFSEYACGLADGTP